MKKGITPVIAVILLLLIAVALVGFAFTFLTGVSTQAQAETEERLSEQARLGNQKVDITTLEYTGAEQLRAVVKNTGTGTIKKGELTVTFRNPDQEIIGSDRPSTKENAPQENEAFTQATIPCVPGSTATAVTAGGFTDKATLVSC